MGAGFGGGGNFGGARLSGVTGRGGFGGGGGMQQGNFGGFLGPLANQGPMNSPAPVPSAQPMGGGVPLGMRSFRGGGAAPGGNISSPPPIAGGMSQRGPMMNNFQRGPRDLNVGEAGTGKGGTDVRFSGAPNMLPNWAQNFRQAVNQNKAPGPAPIQKTNRRGGIGMF